MTDHPGKEALDAIIAGLDGVTPGPWEAFPHIRISDANSDVGVQSKKGPLVAACGRDGNTHSRVNATHIARCDPDTMRTIAAYVAEVERERDAAFAMSKCECGSEEACRNLATATARAEAAEARLKQAVEVMGKAAGYISSPFRMSRDEDETARRGVLIAALRQFIKEQTDGS